MVLNMAKKKDTTTVEKPTLRTAQEEIVRIQIKRFRRDYNEYLERPDTQKLVDFFFGRIYDLEAQDTIIQIAINTYDKFKNQLSSETRENLENLIELNKLTHELDMEMAKLLIEKGWEEGQEITFEEYFEMFKQLDNEEARRKQLMMALRSMMVSYQLAHKPFSELLLKAARGFAVMFGVLPLYDFADEGYKATKAVKADVFNKFIDTVTETELAYIVDAFGE